MKKVLITAIALFLLSAPYLVGRMQFNNVIAVCQNLMNDDDGDENCIPFGSDRDIEDTLTVFHFNLTWDETPTFSDYYNSGIKTIFNQ